MDSRSVLLAQIEALGENLTRMTKALDQQDIEQIAPSLRRAVRNRFEWLMKAREKELDMLRKQVDGNLALDICWENFRTTRKDCRMLFRECLAFLEGALIRGVGLDDGICQVADAILADLSYKADIPWQRFTIMAEGEFFTNLTEVIRLRFPEFSIWNLPIAAHEFGHYVAEQLRKGEPSDPFVTILHGEGRFEPDERDIRFLHEQFADLFATYTLGPAYACTSILLSFDPRTADRDGDEHPAAAKRVHFILKALEEMDRDSVAQPQLGIINTLRSLWQGSLEAVGKPEPLSPDVIGQLNSRLNQLYVQVAEKSQRLAGARYNSWSRAALLSAKLLSDKEATQLLEEHQREITLPDVLNAAWLCRIKHWDTHRHLVSGKALALCLEIVRSRG